MHRLNIETAQTLLIIQHRMHRLNIETEQTLLIIQHRMHRNRTDSILLILKPRDQI